MKNTEQCANISLVTVRDLQGTQDRSELCVQGGFYDKDGIYYLTYTEDAVTGPGDARVFLKISKDSVEIRRMGEFKAVIRYRQGEITDTLYETPFGKMDIKIRTSKIVNKLSEKGGTLKIFYTLITGGEDVKNEITLDIELRSEENEV